MVSLVKSVVNWGTNRTSNLPPSDLCEICGKKPKFVEKGFKHPYCSRSCARNGQGPNPTACILRGCRATGKPAFANFCSEEHAQEGVRVGQLAGCEHCGIQPRIVNNLCIACDRKARAVIRLRELSPDGSTFKSLRAQFLSEWEAPRGQPTLEKAYEVVLTRDVQVRHDAYRARLPGAEEIRTFYSSECICDLGHKDGNLCAFKSCGICCTVKSSFKSFAFGEAALNGRFGEGIYSYRNPALADKFATSCTSSPYRVMIACDTIVEPGQVQIEDFPTEAEESIFTPVADGILPAYVLMYTRL